MEGVRRYVQGQSQGSAEVYLSHKEELTLWLRAVIGARTAMSGATLAVRGRGGSHDEKSAVEA